jgi:hypothetical protein
MTAFPEGLVMADQPLRSRKIAILLAPAGTEQAEFTEPRKAVAAAGADVDVIGVQAGSGRTVNHDLDPGEEFTVDKTFDQVSANDTMPSSCPAARSAPTSCAASPPPSASCGASSRPARPPG